MLALLALLSFAAPPPVAVALGDCAAVRAALPTPVTEGERLARLACAAPSEPLDALLATLEGSDLGGYAELIAARTQLEAQPAEAAARLKDRALPGAAGRELRLLRGQALVLAGRSLEGREDLRALMESEFGDEARYFLAVGALDRGEREAALPVLWGLWTRSTRGPWFERASARLAELGEAVPPSAASEAGRERLRARVKALRGDDQHREALALAKEIEAVVPPQGHDSLLASAQIHMAGKDYRGAIGRFTQICGAPAQAKCAPAVLFDDALSHARLGDYETAALLYTRLRAQHPASPQAVTASYKIAYMRHDAGDTEAALKLFSDHLAQYPDSEHGDEALWLTGRAHWKAGRYPEARAAWERLLRGFPKSGLASGAKYWSARALGKLGDAAGEREGLEAVLSGYPVSGHAWFAANRLGWTWQEKPPFPAPPMLDSLAARAAVRRALALTDAGLDAWAREELATIPRENLSREERLALATLLGEAGDYAGGAALAAPLCGKPWGGGDPAAMAACVPRPAAAVVREVAGEGGLNPLLPFAIMQSESALKPWVTSPAGAMGLMQLMPEVGERHYRREFPSGTWDPALLFRARTNAMLGTSELVERRKSLSGVLQGDSLPAVIASYNAGEEAVRRWLPTAGPAPEMDEWSEDISYTETRRYVRTVLGALMRWQWVYATPVKPTAG